MKDLIKDKRMEEEILESDFFQKELDHYGLKYERVSLIREKDGVIVARVCMNSETAILKCFENADFRRELENYDILQSLDIPTIRVFGKSDRSILLEDLTVSDEYRLGMEEDLHDPEVIKANHFKGKRHPSQRPVFHGQMRNK